MVKVPLIPPLLLLNGKLVTNVLEEANILNDFFIGSIKVSMCSHYVSYKNSTSLPTRAYVWTFLQLGNASTTEVNKDWKSQRIFIFFVPKKVIKLAKK